MLKFTLIFTAVFASVHAIPGKHGLLSKPGELLSKAVTSVHDHIKGIPKQDAYREDEKFDRIAENIANQLKGKAAEFNNIFNVTEFGESNGYGYKVEDMAVADTVVSGFGDTTFKKVKGAEGKRKQEDFIEGILALSPITVDGKLKWFDLKDGKKENGTTFHMPRTGKHSVWFKVHLMVSPRKGGHIHVLSVEPDDPRPVVFSELGSETCPDTYIGVCNVAKTFIERQGWFELPVLFAKQLKNVLETIKP